MNIDALTPWSQPVWGKEIGGGLLSLIAVLFVTGYAIKPYDDPNCPRNKSLAKKRLDSAPRLCYTSHKESSRSGVLSESEMVRVG